MLVHDAADSLCNRLTLIFNGCVYCLLSSRVYHENMFFKKEISTTHHASAAIQYILCIFASGVIDDRGKFIYISREELEAVAKYIKQQGRVSITDLAASSNKLIKL